MITAGGQLGKGGPREGCIGPNRAGLRGSGKSEGACLSFPQRQTEAGSGQAPDVGAPALSALTSRSGPLARD